MPFYTKKKSDPYLSTNLYNGIILWTVRLTSFISFPFEWICQICFYIAKSYYTKRNWLLETFYLYGFNPFIVLLGRLFMRCYCLRPLLGLLGIMLSFMRLVLSSLLHNAVDPRLRVDRDFFPYCKEY